MCRLNKFINFIKAAFIIQMHLVLLNLNSSINEQEQKQVLKSISPRAEWMRCGGLSLCWWLPYLLHPGLMESGFTLPLR